MREARRPWWSADPPDPAVPEQDIEAAVERAVMAWLDRNRDDVLDRIAVRGAVGSPGGTVPSPAPPTASPVPAGIVDALVIFRSALKSLDNRFKDPDLTASTVAYFRGARSSMANAVDTLAAAIDRENGVGQ